MKLMRVRIQHFRSCRDVCLEIGDLHALVGANNAGKSAVLRALDFLFNPNAKSLDEESFWNKDTKNEIRVEAVFSFLTEREKETLGPYLKKDGTFHMARYARMGEQNGEADADSEENKVRIGQQYASLVPELEWLQESSVNANKIKEWWKNKDQLTVGGVSFSDFVGGTKAPTVEAWKEKAREFVTSHADKVTMKEAWIDNPRGYANVLKGTLPLFILVPAVRDVTEESKGTKSSPFGKLLHALLEMVTEEHKTKVEGAIRELSAQMNRVGEKK